MADIVFADDQAANRVVIAMHLELKHHKVRHAANGREALERVAERIPDLVILDVMMPEMNGLEACVALREDPATADLPVLLVTAYDNIGSWPLAAKARYNDIIIKPFRMEELHARIDALLGKAQAA